MRHRKMVWIATIIVGVALAGLGVRAARAAGSIGADESLGQIQAILNQIPTGQQALAMGEQYQVQVSFAPGKGTFYLASRNTIVMDDKDEPMRAALNFVHEVNHARFWHESLRAEIGSLSFEEYVRLRVLEEAEGVVRSIEAKMELQAAGVDVGNLYYPLESQPTGKPERPPSPERVACLRPSWPRLGRQPAWRPSSRASWTAGS
jgi:hypothetical protein